jgi:Tfp pilus assembly protein FimT
MLLWNPPVVDAVAATAVEAVVVVVVVVAAVAAVVAVAAAVVDRDWNGNLRMNGFFPSLSNAIQFSRSENSDKF